MALPASAGAPVLVGNNPGSNAPVADRLFTAGGLVAGKARMPSYPPAAPTISTPLGPSRISTASIAGSHGLTFPAGLSGEGLPVGGSVDGLPSGDRRLPGVGSLLGGLLGPLPPSALTG